MEEILIPIFGMVFVVALPVVLLILFAQKVNQAKHAERMAMIEKGIVIEEPEKQVNRYNALRNGLLMIGLALGAIAGILLNTFFNTWEGEFLIFVLAVLGGGIAFVVYFFIAKKMQKEEDKELPNG